MVSSLLSLNFMLFLVIILTNFSLIGIITWSSFWTKLSMGMFWCSVFTFSIVSMQNSTNFSKACFNINWCAFLFQAPHMLVQISRHDFSLTLLHMPKHMPLLNYIHSTHIQNATIIYKYTNLMLDYCKPPLKSKTLIALSPHDFVVRPNHKRTFVMESNVTIHVVALWHLHHNSCIHLNLVSPHWVVLVWVQHVWKHV